MELFNESSDGMQNILPKEGEVNYFGAIISAVKAKNYSEKLLTTIDWQNDVIHMFGKTITTKRKVAWYGDKPYKYSYSNTTKEALPWTKELMELKSKIEEITNESYNSCLLNLYHNGNEGMGWHTDAEKELKKNGTIAARSIGADRKFVFKHKISKEKVALILKNGSLLVMKNQTQDYWLHSLPTTKLVSIPRINLTFRTITDKKLSSKHAM
jgi:alkylated DNA repair dioxygenase AlkB